MSLEALRETIDLLTTRPALWIPGIVCGLIGALFWVILFFGGTFYAGRIFIFVLLALVFCIAGIYGAVKDGSGGIAGPLRQGARGYFRLLIPTLVLVFGIVLIFVLVILTLTLFGLPPDAGMMTFLVFGVAFPTLMLTFFYDTAAILDDKKVFESLHRSIEVVTANMFTVILFFFSCFFIFCTISFVFFVAWTAVLADRLEPITRYNETELAKFTADQIVPMLGETGFAVTAVCIFAAVTVLIPVLYTYKACFYRIISKVTIPIRQTIGEYDSKGRWYKY